MMEVFGLNMVCDSCGKAEFLENPNILNERRYELPEGWRSLIINNSSGLETVCCNSIRENKNEFIIRKAVCPTCVYKHKNIFDFNFKAAQ